MIHELKTLPNHFENSWNGEKNFEIRDNADRGFQKGDIIILKEHTPGLGGGYTLRHINGKITYVTNFHQRKGMVVFGYKILTRDEGGVIVSDK